LTTHSPEGSSVGEEPDDKVLVLADPLGAVSGCVATWTRMVVGRLAGSKSSRFGL
jgi:hypothetical protein